MVVFIDFDEECNEMLVKCEVNRDLGLVLHPTLFELI